MKKLHITLNDDIYAQLQELKKYWKPTGFEMKIPDSTMIQICIHMIYKNIYIPSQHND